MKKENEKMRPEGVCDPDRAAYMIAWRDRHIEKQNELIRGYEESLSLMEALLAFALWRDSTACGEARVARISKKELSEMLGRYASEVRAQEDEFLVSFRPVQDDGEPHEG